MKINQSDLDSPFKDEPIKILPENLAIYSENSFSSSPYSEVEVLVDGRPTDFTINEQGAIRIECNAAAGSKVQITAPAGWRPFDLSTKTVKTSYDEDGEPLKQVGFKPPPRSNGKSHKRNVRKTKRRK